jgi:pyruvate formate-lyase activating enzyme-like uncharacterized protein
MRREIDRGTLATMQNPIFCKYASTYLEIYDDFMEQIAGTGLEIAPTEDHDQVNALISRLRDKGATFRNDDKSIYINQISPACVACREGIGSATFFISLQCNRDCYFCFNPNQENYDYFTQNQRDLVEELDQIKNSGHNIHHLALTGGEPLLHMDETLAFFEKALKDFPQAHTRLYTCGDFLDEDSLQNLQGAGLEEIRFSIRLHDREESQQITMAKIAQATDFIPSVMVEMPVLPDTQDIMKRHLVQLDQIGISSINLLEFCFPFRNVRTFRNKDYKIKNPPYRVLYNYWYAGGLPIAESELECLRLMEFAMDEGLNIGVHYCSLENKHTGQIYQQNAGKKVSPRYHFSEKDFFYKSAKVFGEDIPKVQELIRQSPNQSSFRDTDHDYLEFHVRNIEFLKGLPVEIGISYNVMEKREDEEYMRELKVELTYPDQFDFDKDV